MEMEKMNEKKNTRLKVISIFSCILFITVLLFWLFFQPGKTSEPTDQEINSRPQSSQIAEADYAAQKAINEDYIGHLYFESGLVDELVVQGDDNEFYLNNTAAGEYSTHGAVYMDYRNHLSDQNLIFYGHYVYDDETLMFSPLHQLKETENYEVNKKLVLELENEIRQYEIAHVYYYEMGNENLEYFHPVYDQDQLEDYLQNVSEKQFYDTGVSIAEGDRILTLQTCVRNREDLRLIVIAKEIMQNTF